MLIEPWALPGSGIIEEGLPLIAGEDRRHAMSAQTNTRMKQPAQKRGGRASLT